MASPELNRSQRTAVEMPPGPLLIVAGAGTGKTRTLTSRLLRLLREGVPARSICALTFTNKAAREMLDRVRAALPKRGRYAEAPFLGTFHSLGARILRAEAQYLGRTKDFVIFDDHDSFDLMKRVLKRFDARTKAGPSAFLGVASAIKNEVMPRAAFARSGTQFEERALDAFDRYEADLKRQNAFDFDDLIQKTVVLFREHPDVLARHANRFEHLLVDEYQDVNNMQYELVKLLAGAAKNLTVVGDDQQTIYGWRGSNVEIFLNFERDWPGSRTVVLEENYRSSGNIIQAASAVVAHNRRQKPKTLWTKNPPGSLVRIKEALHEKGEAAWIIDEVQRLKIKDQNDERETTGEIQNEKIKIQNLTTAILYRTNAQSRALEEALIKRGIPYAVFGGLKFYERREIKDIVAALRYATNPKDDLSRDRLRKLLRKARFREVEPALLSLGARAPRDIIGAFLETADYLAYVEENLTNPDERRENIAELMRFAAEFEDAPAFLERVSLLQATDDLTMTNNHDDDNGGHGHSYRHRRVALMTIHLAKGLEFDRVFVAGVNEGLLPHTRSLASDSELEEERRLLYVAMTRARRELSLSFYDLPSRFLSEIPQELTAFIESASREIERDEDDEPVVRVD